VRNDGRSVVDYRGAPARRACNTGVSTMNVRAVLLWGFAGTTILTTIMRGAAAMGRTRIDLPLILGLMLTPNRDRAKVYGFLIHLVNGWLFALVYATVFQYFRRATWWL